MSHEGNPWTTGAIITTTAVALAAGIIGGLVVFGGQDWLLPGRSRPNVAAPQLDDEEFGLADYVDRTLFLDREGRLSIDGREYDNDGLRDYLKRLHDGGGVQVSLRVDSDGPSYRREAVEKVCQEVTGLKPDVYYGIEMASPLTGDAERPSVTDGDLEADRTAP